MPSLFSFHMLLIGILLLTFTAQIPAQQTQTTSSATSANTASSTPPITGGTTSRATNLTQTSTQPASVATKSTAPDVYLNVPDLHVGRIELDVDNLQADINLAANVAQLVQINAGVQVSVQKINVTITDVDAELELIVRLGHLVDIVNRVFSSLDLNPLLITAINNVTSLVGEVVGAVDGLLGSITQGGTTLNFLIDNLGNIVQEVVGGATGTVSTIVGNYLQNMTFTGQSQQLGNGLVQKTYSYSPLNALVNIILNSAGQVVQATVAKQTGATTTTGSATSTATPVSLPVSSAAPTSS